MELQQIPAFQEFKEQGKQQCGTVCPNTLHLSAWRIDWALSSLHAQNTPQMLKLIGAASGDVHRLIYRS